MKRKLESIFLLSILFLGLASAQGTLFANNDHLITGFAFAQSEDESEIRVEAEAEVEVRSGEDDDEDREQTRNSDVDETENDEELDREEIEIEVKIKNGIAYVDIDNGDREMELVIRDFEDREDIITKIIEETGLSRQQVMAAIEFEVEDEESEDRKEIEIEVEIKDGIAYIDIDMGDREMELVIRDFEDREDIITKIIEETGLSRQQVMAAIEFEVDDKQREDRKEKMREREARAAERQAEIEARFAVRMDDSERLAQMIQEREAKTLERAEKIIRMLEERIAQLETRVQVLLEKVESGEYYGPISEEYAVTKTFNIVLEGSASVMGDTDVTQDMSGEIFVETLVHGENVSKFRVTGGDLVIGDTIYDIAFGKARASSAGTSGVKDSMIIIANLDDGVDTTTVKLVINADTSINAITSEPVNIEVLSPQSKIASQWFLSGSGQMVLTEG